MVVVVLKGQSLFSEGVINRLEQLLEDVELRVMDACQPDVLDLITAIQPSAVIIDDSNPDLSQICILEKLLAVVPMLKVIRLDPESTWVQIVQWNHFEIAEVRDLVEVIEPPSSFSMSDSLSEVTK